MIHDKRVCRFQSVADTVQQGPVGRLGSFIEKAEVNSRLFAALKVRLAEGYGIEIFCLNDQIRCTDAQLLKLACNLSAEDVISDNAYDLYSCRLDGGKISYNIGCTAERIVMFADRLGLQARFNRDFRAARVEQPVGVKTKITVDGYLRVLNPG